MRSKILVSGQLSRICATINHLLLNRLENIYERDGVKLPRQLSWDMVVRVDELVAQPVLEQMCRELLAEEVLHADETSVTLRLEDQQGNKGSWGFGWRSLRDAGFYRGAWAALHQAD